MIHRDDETATVLAADRAFFDALLAGDAGRAAELLTDDFLIVDVGRGAVSDRAAFVGMLASGVVAFEQILTDPAEASVRRYADAAVVVGSTRMRFRVGPDQRIEAHSRYTHVFVRPSGSAGWRLASAQGTPISG
jgi:ketosteroid isomerase-like protein